MKDWYATIGYFRAKDNEFQYNTNVELPAVYSVISDFNYCEYSQCDANKAVKMLNKRDSDPIWTSAHLKNDGGKWHSNLYCIFRFYGLF